MIKLEERERKENKTELNENSYETKSEIAISLFTPRMILNVSFWLNIIYVHVL